MSTYGLFEYLRKDLIEYHSKNSTEAITGFNLVMHLEFQLGYDLKTSGDINNEVAELCKRLFNDQPTAVTYRSDFLCWALVKNVVSLFDHLISNEADLKRISQQQLMESGFVDQNYWLTSWSPDKVLQEDVLESLKKSKQSWCEITSRSMKVYEKHVFPDWKSA